MNCIPDRNTKLYRPVCIVLMILLIISLLQSTGCKGIFRNQHPESAYESISNTSSSGLQQNLTERWGIEIIGIRQTAAGHMLDFRYRVIDSEKASLLLKRQSEVYLIDQATGTKLGVPISKLGPMRTTAVKPEAIRDYFILFSNPSGLVKQGARSRWSLAIVKQEILL
jgi:hypothetical protein